MELSENKRIFEWGIFLDSYTLTEFIGLIEDHLNSNKGIPLHLTGVNPETIVQAHSNLVLRNAIIDSDYVNIDNYFVLTLLRCMGYKISSRVATPDLFFSLLLLASRKNYSAFFLGATQIVIEGVMQYIPKNYPGLVIAGSQHGYFKPEEIDTIIRTIKASNPHMVFVALPTPQKEIFITKLKMELKQTILLGVGGAFDVLAGKVKRAPSFLRSLGLEGLHRSFQDPLNYGKRYSIYYIPFLKMSIKSILRCQ